MNNDSISVKLFLSIGLMLTCLCKIAVAEDVAREKFVVGFFDLPPHAHAPAENKQSPAMLFFDQVANNMGVEVEYVHYPLAHLLFMLETNRIDAALMLAKNEERSRQFVYPSSPIFTTTPSIAVLKDGRIKTLEQMTSSDVFTIGVWRGGFHSSIMEKNKNKTIALTGNNIAQRGLIILARGRIDAFFSPDSYSVVYAAKKNNLSDKITILPISNEGIDLYTVFSKQSAGIYQKPYEVGLAKVKAKNTYEALLKQYTDKAH